MKKILFIDRDGTLIEEPADEQIDAFEKLKFMRGVFRNLSFIRSKLDFEFVLVSNQDGLGTSSFPEDTFWPVHNFILQTLEGEGITFDDILIDRHFPEDNAPTRKPNTGLVEKYIHSPEYDIAGSYVIGDRDTDRQFAENIGCNALILGKDGMTWDKISELLFAGERTAEVKRTTKETDIHVCINLDGIVPACGELNDTDRATIDEFKNVKADVERLLDGFRFRDAQKEAMNLARIGNKYLADAEPWKVIKTDPERVKTIINLSLQLVANLAIAFEPFLPFSSAKLKEMLAVEGLSWASLGATDLLPAGHKIGEPALLFEKIEDSVVEAQVAKLQQCKKEMAEAAYKAEPVKSDIAFSDFEKLDIRVGTVLSCERVPKMKKLLKFEIADGLENRTIVSGIAMHYEPEALVGKQVCFIANLPPREFKGGLVSQGMILSAVNCDGTLSVITPERKVAAGSSVC